MYSIDQKQITVYLKQPSKKKSKRPIRVIVKALRLDELEECLKNVSTTTKF